MAGVVRTHAAEDDLAQIVEHISSDNLDAALAWLDDVERLFRLLATHPRMGQRLRSRGASGIRHHSFGNYVIYYVPQADGISVVRVLHAAREPPKFK